MFLFLTAETIGLALGFVLTSKLVKKYLAIIFPLKDCIYVVPFNNFEGNKVEKRFTRIQFHRGSEHRYLLADLHSILFWFCVLEEHKIVDIDEGKQDSLDLLHYCSPPSGYVLQRRVQKVFCV